MCTQEHHRHDMRRALRTMSRRRTPSTQAIPEVAFLSLTSLCSDTKKIRQTFNRGVTRLRKILSSSCSGLLCFEEITLRQFFLYILALAIKGYVFFVLSLRLSCYNLHAEEQVGLYCLVIAMNGPFPESHSKSGSFKNVPRYQTSQNKIPKPCET